MADLVLSPVLQVVFDRLASPLLRKLGNVWNLSDNFEKLKRTLVYVQSVLEDAEEKQVTDRDVKIWLSELKHVVYDAEDLLDEITITEALLDSEEQRSGMRFYFFHRGYTDRVRKMLDKLETISEEGSKFNLRERSIIHGRIETSSYVIESEVYGREEDREKIVELLLSDEATQGVTLSCIPIVGLGGMGKTTLTQLVYNDQRVTQYFNAKVWVFVSDHFDANIIMMAIIESLTKQKYQYASMDALHATIRDLLHDKRYLIVLDDVWTENQGDWDKLRPLFRSVIDGSRIIITTRSKRVARMLKVPTTAYYLDGLSEEACWSLFLQFAFQAGEEKEHQHLLPIGQEIVKKCRGVALAAKTLGSLMCFKREEREWLAVQNSELWNLSESESEILPALRLSYHHLPPYLKRCFSFCSIIPRRFEIKKEKLIRQWIAAGLVQLSREGESPEETGNDCFNDLLWMSFFQEVKQCNKDACITGYRMHDIIYDLAQSVAGTEFSIVDHTSVPRYPAQIRHSSVVCDFRSSSMIPKKFYKAKHLRTLFIFSEGGFREVPRKLFSSFRYLRELDMSGCGLEVLDGSIGNLICLRYLDISYTHIKELPCSIEKLLFLQTLNVAGCYNLTSLPVLANMSNLRHLNNTGCIALTTMVPLNRPFNQLQSHTELSAEEHNELIQRALPPYTNQLQTLPLFVVSGLHDMKLLERLDLHGTLKIVHLENLHDQGGIDFHILNRMKGVESLGLYWGDDDHCPNINPEEDYGFTRFQERKQVHSSGPSQRLEASESLELLITCFQPNKYVKRLTVKGYLGTRFPDYWLLSSNLTVVNLIDFGKCEELPSLGHLKLLNSLSLQKMPAVRHIDIRFYVERHLHSTTPPFQVLRELVLIDFPNLEEWSSPDDGDGFPSLRKLIVSKCPKLNMMPKIPSIQHLELRDCDAALVHSFQRLTSLTILVMEKVRDLSTFPGAFPVNNHLLATLDIISCPLRFLPNFGNLTALKALTIRWCQELSYLPQGMQLLSALESLEIGDCHSLMFLPEIGYGGFSNLKTLSIENCNNLTSLSMGFKNLTSLEHLNIMYCPSLVTLPHGVQNLSALQSLTILGCSPEFMSLPVELQNLTRLHSLEIRSCPGLEALPDWIEKLVSLRSLAISDCQCITSLPESTTRLTGLQHLSIQNCSQLLERCRPQDGEDWPKIVHVPYKHIGPPELHHPSEASSSSN